MERWARDSACLGAQRTPVGDLRGRYRELGLRGLRFGQSGLFVRRSDGAARSESARAPVSPAAPEVKSSPLS